MALANAGSAGRGAAVGRRRRSSPRSSGRPTTAATATNAAASSSTDDDATVDKKGGRKERKKKEKGAATAKTQPRAKFRKRQREEEGAGAAPRGGLEEKKGEEDEEMRSRHLSTRRLSTAAAGGEQGAVDGKGRRGSPARTTARSSSGRKRHRDAMRAPPVPRIDLEEEEEEQQHKVVVENENEREKKDESEEKEQQEEGGAEGVVAGGVGLRGCSAPAAAVVAEIRQSLAESTSISWGAEGGAAAEGSEAVASASAAARGGPTASEESHITVLPCGYVKYSAFRRRWDVNYRPLAASLGESVGSAEYVAARICRKVSRSRSKMSRGRGAAAASASSAGGGRAGRTRRRQQGSGSPSSSPGGGHHGGRQHHGGGGESDAGPAPPDFVVQSILRRVELRLLLELASPSDDARLHTRQGRVLGLRPILDDLSRLSSDTKDRGGPLSASSNRARCLGLLRTAASEAVPPTLRVGGSGGRDGDTDVWQVEVVNSRLSGAAAGGECLSPSSSGFAPAQISYARSLVEECLGWPSSDSSAAERSSSSESAAVAAAVDVDRVHVVAPAGTSSVVDGDEDDSTLSAAPFMPLPPLAVTGRGGGGGNGKFRIVGEIVSIPKHQMEDNSSSSTAPPQEGQADADGTFTSSSGAENDDDSRMTEEGGHGRGPPRPDGSPASADDGAAGTLNVEEGKDDGKKRPKKRARMEVEMLAQQTIPSWEHSSATAAAPTAASAPSAADAAPSPTGRRVQLFASDFASSDNIDPSSDGRAAGGRPKRKIKQAVRFNAAPHSYALEKRKLAAIGRTGGGFLCPQCSFVCSYDSRQCPMCKLPCRYAPGRGVEIVRDREEVTKEASVAIKGELNFCDADDAAKNNSNTEIGNGIKVRSSGSRASRDGKPSNSSRRQKGGRLKQVTKPAVRKSGADQNSLESTKVPSRSRVVGEEATSESQDIGECEACLQLFTSSYIQGHRKRFHGLSPDEFGCPYCTLRYKSAEKREDHIQKKHPGLPSKLSAEIRSKNKFFMYFCPFCDEKTFNLGGLRNHLRTVHGRSVLEVFEQINCLCPFCPQTGKSKKYRFKNVERLESHVSKAHKGCNLFGGRLSSATGPAQQISFEGGMKLKRSIVTKESDRSHTFKGRAVNAHDSRDDSEARAVQEQDNGKKYWNELSCPPIVAGNSTGNSTFGVHHLRSADLPVDIVLEKIDEKLRLLQQHIAAPTKQNKDGLDEDQRKYAAEMRLYQRGVRERQVKADSERLEKEKYKAKCEQKILMWQYANRGKKKTLGDIEEDAILSRPINYVSRAGRRKLTQDEQCCVGDHCSLCNGAFAQYVVTEDEIEKANGNILNALPLPLSEPTEEKVLSPFFKETSSDIESDDDDSIDAHKEDDRSCSNGTEEKSRRLRSTNKTKEAQEEIGPLTEMKHTLSFIQAYNKGLLEPLKRQSV